MAERHGPNQLDPTAVRPILRRVTSYDVARHAGVSQSAVSRCFTKGASVAPAVRERIFKVADELCYRPNALAQGLGSKRTNLVAMLVSSVTNLYYSEALAEISRELLARDMRVLLFSLEEEGGVAEVIDQIWRHSVDGIISQAKLSSAQIQLFADRGIPLVLYNRSSQQGRVPTVACDSAAGETEMVTRLLAAGHRRFGMIGGTDHLFRRGREPGGDPRLGRRRDRRRPPGSRRLEARQRSQGAPRADVARQSLRRHHLCQ